MPAINQALSNFSVKESHKGRWVILESKEFKLCSANLKPGTDLVGKT